MEYREIVAVTGLGGLYQLLTTKSDGAIVRSVADKSTRFISARQHNVTPLESIEVYTIGENVRLHHVFQKMKENEETVPIADAKTADNKAIKGYFKSIFPEFDEERVYVSDMKKMLKWYEVLKANNLLRFEEQIAGENENGEPETTTVAENASEATNTEITEEIAAASTDKTGVEATDKIEAVQNEGASSAEPSAEEQKPAKKAAKKKTTEE